MPSGRRWSSGSRSADTAAWSGSCGGVRLFRDWDHDRAVFHQRTDSVGTRVLSCGRGAHTLSRTRTCPACTPIACGARLVDATFGASTPQFGHTLHWSRAGRFAPVAQTDRSGASGCLAGARGAGRPRACPNDHPRCWGYRFGFGRSDFVGLGRAYTARLLRTCPEGLLS